MKKEMGGEDNAWGGEQKWSRGSDHERKEMSR